MMSCRNSLQTSGSWSTLRRRKSLGVEIEFSKLYVVISVFSILRLVITKCKNSKNKVDGCMFLGKTVLNCIKVSKK